MERREFLKVALGFVAAAGAIAGTAAQAAPLPPSGDAPKPTDPAAAAARAESDKLEQEVATRDGDLASGDTDYSARRWWRRRRRWWRRRRVWYRRRRRVYWRRRRRWWRRRRVIYY